MHPIAVELPSGTAVPGFECGACASGEASADFRALLEDARRALGDLASTHWGRSRENADAVVARLDAVLL